MNNFKLKMNGPGVGLTSSYPTSPHGGFGGPQFTLGKYGQEGGVWMPGCPERREGNSGTVLFVLACILYLSGSLIWACELLIADQTKCSRNFHLLRACKQRIVVNQHVNIECFLFTGTRDLRTLTWNFTTKNPIESNFTTSACHVIINQGRSYTNSTHYIAVN